MMTKHLWIKERTAAIGPWPSHAPWTLFIGPFLIRTFSLQFKYQQQFYKNVKSTDRNRSIRKHLCALQNPSTRSFKNPSSHLQIEKNLPPHLRFLRESFSGWGILNDCYENRVDMTRMPPLSYQFNQDSFGILGDSFELKTRVQVTAR